MNTLELKAEMTRHNDTGVKLAEYLEISPSTFSLKINGELQFNQREIASIKDKYDLAPERVVDIFFA